MTQIIISSLKSKVMPLAEKGRESFAFSYTGLSELEGWGLGGPGGEKLPSDQLTPSKPRGSWIFTTHYYCPRVFRPSYGPDTWTRAPRAWQRIHTDCVGYTILTDNILHSIWVRSLNLQEQNAKKLSKLKSVSKSIFSRIWFWDQLLNSINFDKLKSLPSPY